MTQFFLCLLALLFSVSGPEIERNAEFWHSRFAAKSGRATWNEFQAATRGQFATPEQAWTRTGRKASVLTKTARRQPTAPKTQLSLPAPKQPVALLPEAAESLAAKGQLSTIAGEGMDPALFARMKAAFERQGGRILQGGDVEGYLRAIGAEGSTANAKFIQLRVNPSTSAVYEEFIHTAQMRAGRTGTEWIRQNEIDAAEKLIRFRHQYGIPNAETRRTIERLRQLRGGE